MKNIWSYLLLMMAIAAMPLMTSCENNEVPDVEEEEQQNPSIDGDRTKVKAFDALEWLQGSLVVVDDSGEVVRRVYGKPLDDSRPTVISVPVIDSVAAEELFLSWVAPDKSITKVEGGHDYNLTDAKGNAQGSVSFRTVEGEAGVMARMTVAEGTDLKQVSEVEFVDASLWPENDAIEKYEAGKIYMLKGVRLVWLWSTPNNNFYGDPHNEELPFYCIQGNTDGKEAILVWICPDVNEAGIHPWPSSYILRDLYIHLPTVSVADRVLKFYNSNYDFWQNMLKEMDALGYQWSPNPDWGGETTDRSEFILNSYDKKEKKITYLDLDDDEGEYDTASYSSWYYYRYMQIHIVPPYIE